MHRQNFQHLMNEIFQPYSGKLVLVFFDDILVYSGTMEEHFQHLKVVLGSLQEHELYANARKCVFGQGTIKYLGHVISEEGVAADPHKIEVMIN